MVQNYRRIVVVERYKKAMPLGETLWLTIRNMKTLYQQLNGGAVYMRQHFFYYNFHWHVNMWHKPFFVNDKSLAQCPNFQTFRDKQGLVAELKLITCGWHCLFFTSVDEILQKVHSEFQSINKEFIQKCIYEGADLFMREGECNFQRNFIPIEKLPNEFAQFQRYLYTIQ